jgi:hypothetical protein
MSEDSVSVLTSVSAPAVTFHTVTDQRFTLWYDLGLPSPTMAYSSANFESEKDDGDDSNTFDNGGDAAEALDAFMELAPEEQEKRLKEQEKRFTEGGEALEVEHEATRQEEQAGVFRMHLQPEAEEQTQTVAKQQEQQQQQQRARHKRNERSALLHKHQNLSIIDSAAVVDAVAPPVPEALNRDSRSVLQRIFGEHEQNGVVDQQQMR